MTMEYVDGFNIDNLERLKNENFDVKEVSSILADCFSRQIFEFGFLHSDPHGGNVFVRKTKVKGKEITQLVLLDHGLYKKLDENLRTHYAYLWKGIINQDPALMEKGCLGMDVPKELFKLFAAMITAKDYEELMDDSKKDIKERLSLEEEKKDVDALRRKTQVWMKEILQCLEKMNQDLLLVFKVNDYLRTIDFRLNNPINTFYYTVIAFFYLRPNIHLRLLIGLRIGE